MVRTDLLYYKYFAKHVRVRFKYVSDRVKFLIQFEDSTYRNRTKKGRERGYEASIDFAVLIVNRKLLSWMVNIFF